MQKVERPEADPSSLSKTGCTLIDVIEMSLSKLARAGDLWPGIEGASMKKRRGSTRGTLMKLLNSRARGSGRSQGKQDRNAIGGRFRGRGP